MDDNSDYSKEFLFCYDLFYVNLQQLLKSQEEYDGTDPLKFLQKNLDKIVSFEEPNSRLMFLLNLDQIIKTRNILAHSVTTNYDLFSLIESIRLILIIISRLENVYSGKYTFSNETKKYITDYYSSNVQLFLYISKALKPDTTYLKPLLNKYEI